MCVCRKKISSWVKAADSRSHKGGSGPGVVVIQEWWGLVDHIRDVCDRLAAEGFVALAPDLYGGRTTHDADEAAQLARDVDDFLKRKKLQPGYRLVERTFAGNADAFGGIFEKLLADCP